MARSLCGIPNILGISHFAFESFSTAGPRPGTVPREVLLEFITLVF